MVHDNVLSALKQVSDIPIHPGKLKTIYGSALYWLKFQEQKLQHSSCWGVNGDQVSPYDELTTSALSLVDSIGSEGADVPFRDKILRKLAWSNSRNTHAISYLYSLNVLHTIGGKCFSKWM